MEDKIQETRCKIQDARNKLQTIFNNQFSNSKQLDY